MEDLSTRLIREYVTHLNSKPSEGAEAYRRAAAAAGTLSVAAVTEEHVKDIVQPFLYVWGWMERVLERTEYVGWQSRLAERVCSNAATLEQLRVRELSTTDLSQQKLAIAACYGSFAGKDVIGPIAAAKTLHLFCPGLLPPWDRKIARAAKAEWSGRSSDGEKTKKLSAEDYYRFVAQVKQFILDYDGVISELATRYGKTKVKTVDECFWWATQKPLFFFLGNSRTTPLGKAPPFGPSVAPTSERGQVQP